MKTLLLPVFLLFTCFAFCQEYKSSLLIPYRIENKWGYSDTLGNIITPPKYDSVGFYDEKTSIAIAYNGGRAGLINAKQEAALPFEYDKITQYYHPSRYFVLWKKDKIGWYDAIAKKIIIPPLYSEIDYVGDSLIYLKQNNKLGVANTKGKILVPTEYDNLTRAELWNDYADTKNKLIGSKGSQRILIDLTNGRKKKIPGEFSEGVYAYGDVYADSNDPSVPNKREGYDSAINIHILRSAGFAAEATLLYKQGKVGLEWSDGLRIAPTYDKITQVGETNGRNSRSFIIAFKNGKAGLIDKREQIILPFVFDNLFDLTLRNIKTVKENKIGMVIFSTVYPPISNLYEYLAIERDLPVSKRWTFVILRVKKNNKWGYVGENGIEYFK